MTHYYKFVDLDRNNIEALIGAQVGAIAAYRYMKAIGIEGEVEQRQTPPISLVQETDASDYDVKEERSFWGAADAKAIWIDAGLPVVAAFHVGAHEAVHTLFKTGDLQEDLAVEVSAAVCVLNRYAQWCTHYRSHPEPEAVKAVDAAIGPEWRDLMLMSVAVKQGDTVLYAEVLQRREARKQLSVPARKGYELEFPEGYERKAILHVTLS